MGDLFSRVLESLGSPTCIGLATFASIAGAAVSLVIWLGRGVRRWWDARRTAPVASLFPFECVPLSGLRGVLLKRAALSLVDNAFVERLEPLDPCPARLLIVAPSERGKTREAVELIERLGRAHPDNVTVLLPKGPWTPCPIPADMWADVRFTEHVVLFWDDLQNAAGGRCFGAHERAGLQLLLDDVSKRCSRFTFTATIREELMAARMPELDLGAPERFVAGSTVLRLPPLTASQVREVAVGLACRYGLDLDEEAAEALALAGDGNSAEALVQFFGGLGRAGHVRIRAEDVDTQFRRVASEAWRDNSYRPLVRRYPDAEAIYGALAWLRSLLDVPPTVYCVLDAARPLLTGPRVPAFRWRRARRALRLLVREGYVLVDGGKVVVPDYHTDSLPVPDSRLAVLRWVLPVRLRHGRRWLRSPDALLREFPSVLFMLLAYADPESRARMRPGLAIAYGVYEATHGRSSLAAPLLDKALKGAYGPEARTFALPIAAFVACLGQSTQRATRLAEMVEAEGDPWFAAMLSGFLSARIARDGRRGDALSCAQRAVDKWPAHALIPVAMALGALGDEVRDWALVSLRTMADTGPAARDELRNSGPKLLPTLADDPRFLELLRADASAAEQVALALPAASEPPSEVESLADQQSG